MAELFANSGDPDQTSHSVAVIWIRTVCQLPFSGICRLKWANGSIRPKFSDYRNARFRYV